MGKGAVPLRMPWDARKLDWLIRAAAWTGFPRKLAALLLPHLSPGASLCDLGCGAGLTDLALAPVLGSVTCLDRSQAALSALASLAAAQRLSNVETVLGDAEQLSGVWDHTLLISFGRPEQYPLWLAHCRRSLIAVVREDSSAAFGPGHPAKHNTADRTAAFLDGHGIPYTLTRHVLEYGQPLRSREDAVEFVQAYATDASADIGPYLDRALRSTGDGAFPLYLPNQKRFGIFVLPSAREEENR